jgi:acyl-CoA synthetase (NDP forming)/RimJ/RimL family protein N-acetyltransferase
MGVLRLGVTVGAVTVASESQPRPLIRDVLLRDGSTLRLLATTPSDYEDIKAFYDGLSPESAYFRFHGAGRTDIVARAEAEASGVDRLALIGRHDGRVIAASSYDGLREPGAAEVAFAVSDEYQRRGIGTRMLEQLAALAAQRGIRRFDAEVMAANRRMLGVFEHAGFAVRREGSFGEVTVSLDITPSDVVQEVIDQRDHHAAIASLRPILAPSSIAVVGADEAHTNIGRAVLANVVSGGFRGVVMPVNRDGGVVSSMHAARSLGDLAVTPELVIACANGEELLEIAADAAAVGARALLVLPDADSDDGGGGSEQDERLLEVLRDAGLRMVGPGSLGVVNTAADVSLNATFSGASVQTGGLAIGSHGDALGLGLLGHAEARQLGVSIYVALGSLADVSTNDLLEWCREDSRTSAMLLYVETFGDPDRFTRIARSVSREKPILVVKGRRRAEQLRSEAKSQTASALRGDALVDAILHHAGVLRFRNGEELFDAAELFARQPLPRGREIGIIANSRAVATLAADACATRGLNVSEASRGSNPLVLGVGAGPQDYATSVRSLLGDAGIDALMVYYVDRHEGDPEGVIEAISAAAQGYPKPVVASVVGSDGRLPSRTESAVPNFLFPESCAAVLARAAERRAWLSRPLGERPEYPDLDPGAATELVAAFLGRRPSGGWLGLDEAAQLLATHGIPVTASHRCTDAESAVAAARAIGGPVAMKADFAAPAHASQIHAVLLGLEGHTGVESGWRELERRVSAARREWGGVIVQRLVAPGADVLVGAFRDPDLGAVLGVGLGGRQAGFAGNAAFRLPPDTDVEADELIDACESVAHELDGLPGTAPLDRGALRELILRFALLLRAVPELAEADLNSVRCSVAGCSVLDLRVRIGAPRPVDRVKTW